MKKIIHSSKQYINNVALTFMTIFSMIIGTFALIEGLIFQQNAFIFKYAVVIAIIAFVLSNLIVLFFKINKIKSFVQIIVVYSSFVIIIFIMGFLFGWFSFSRGKFFLTAIIITILGLLIFILINYFKRRHEEEKLNKSIMNYKERIEK